MEEETSKSKITGTYVFWTIIVILIIISFSGDSENSIKNTSNSNHQPNINSNSYNSSDNYENDGYAWAENNDISSFTECQDQFGTGYEEDECNRYVKENYSGYKSFSGYECTEDCSGHEAGYEWAEENDIDDEYDCDGNSNSFNEGCTAYVEENN